MTPRWQLRIATTCLGIVPITQLCILSWWGAKTPSVQGVIGPGELGLAIPQVSLTFAAILLAWTVMLAILKSPSAMHVMLQMVLTVILSIQFHVAGMKIGAWSGLAEEKAHSLPITNDGSERKQ